VAHGPRKRHILAFGSNPEELQLDPGIFKGNFSIAVLAMLNKGNSPKIRRLTDLKLNELKAALEVCAIRVLLF